MFYSAKLGIFPAKEKEREWTSHVIMTDNGLAFKGWMNYDFQQFCSIKNGDLYYIPWHVVSVNSTKMMLMLVIFVAPRILPLFYFHVIKDEDIDVIKSYKQRKIELIERATILIIKSKSKIYEKLSPILRTYPKGQIPKKNPTDICIQDAAYNDLRFRLVNDLQREKLKGTFQYPVKIKPPPKNISYDNERIIKDLQDFKFNVGTYETQIKIEELEIVFPNYFKQNSTDDAINLAMKLYEINPDFFLMWFPKVKVNLLKLYPEKEQDLFELENKYFEKTVFNEIFKADEQVIAHFKGTVNLPKAHFKFPGHIWVTNYRLYGPSMPTLKTRLVPDVIPFGTVVTGLITSAINRNIVNKRKAYLEVLAKNPDMFFINKPYNIKIDAKGNLKFTMNIDYYKLAIVLEIDKYQKESLQNYNQRKREIYSKIRDYFSTIPETVCSNCGHVQDKNLDNCEKCGKSMKFKV